MKKYIYIGIPLAIATSAVHAQWTYKQLVSCLLKDECISYVPTQGKLVDNGAEPWFYPVEGTDFGSVLTTKSTVHQFIASNIGTGDLTVYGFKTKKGDTPFQYLRSDCPLTGEFVLRPGAACTVNVKFSPQKAGMFENALELLHSSPLSPEVVLDIKGAGVEPTPAQIAEQQANLESGKDGTIPVANVPKSPVTPEEVRAGLRLSTKALNFGEVMQGASSPSQSVQIFNDTDVPLHPFEISSTAPSLLSSNHNCFPTIPAKGSCTLSVSLSSANITKPALNAAYQIKTSEAVNADVQVVANVVGSKVVATPNPLEVLTTSNTLEGQSTLTLSNVGNSSATLSSIQVADSNNVSGYIAGANFSTKARVVAQGCGVSLPAGATCEITIGYKSAVEGSEQGSVKYAVNGVVSAVPIKAKMILPDLIVVENGYDFGAVDIGKSVNKTFTISNKGDKSVSITDIVPSSSFIQISENQCLTSLDINESCTIAISFKGDVLNQSTRKHEFSIINNGDLPSTVGHVTGKSVGGYIEVSATNYDFKKVEYSVDKNPLKEIAITNIGNKDIEGLSVSIDNPQFKIVSTSGNTCVNKATLKFKETCTFNLSIDASIPTDNKVVSGNVRISGNAANTLNGFTIPVKGEVSGGIIQASPSNILFGNVAYGSTQEKIVTVKNTGVKPATLEGVITYGARAISYVDNTCTAGKVLAPNATCSLKVVMSTTPSAKDGAYLSLGVKSDVANAVTGINVSGTTAGSWLSATSPATIVDSKANVVNRRSVFINNGGYTPLIVKNITITNPLNGTWTPVSTECTAQYNTGCTLYFDVQPSTYGETSAVLTMQTNDARYPTYSIPVSGSVYAGGGAIYLEDKISSNYDFGVLSFGSTKSVAGRLVNYGEQPITVTALSASGWNVNGCVGQSLAPNTQCMFNLSTTMGVTSNPATQTKALTATFTNADMRSVSISIKPTGSSAVLSANTYDFGSQVYQVQKSITFTIHNEGVSPMSLGAWNVDANDEFQITDNCGSSLAAGATCTATVKFAPKVEGSRTFVFERSSSGFLPAEGSIKFTAKGLGKVANPIALATLAGTPGTRYTVPLSIVNKGSSGLVMQSISAVNGSSYNAVITNPSNCSAISSLNACNYQLAYTKPADGTAPLKLKLVYTGGPSPLEIDIKSSDSEIADSCSAVKAAYPASTNGSYLLNKQGTIAPVYCDQETDGGGWELAYVNSYELAQTNPSVPLKHIPYKAFAKGQLIATGSAIPGMPTLPSNYVNDFKRVLIKGGSSAWQAAAGPWVSFDTLNYSASKMSAFYSNVKTANGGKIGASGAVGWGVSEVNTEDPFSIVNDYERNPLCGGAGWGAGKNCMAFSPVNSFLDNYPYHYEVRSYREVYFRK